MVSATQLGLPLVMPAQAQKHVTVNEALAKLDALANLRLASFGRTVAPGDPRVGQSYFIAEESFGPWAGQAGTIATYTNGGWTFTRPLLGWRAWDEETETWRVFDGQEWIGGGLTVRSSGSAASLRTDDFDHVVEPGLNNTTAYSIPKNAMVLGVSGRVRVPIQGSGLTSWRLGINGSDGRYGTSLGTALNSYVLGLTGSPITYYESTRLQLSAEGGQFGSGLVGLSVHYICLSMPREV